MGSGGWVWWRRGWVAAGMEPADEAGGVGVVSIGAHEMETLVR